MQIYPNCTATNFRSLAVYGSERSPIVEFALGFGSTEFPLFF